LILCVCAISKKYLKTKRKTLFDLRFFYLSQGEEREDKKRKTKKEQYTHTGQKVICLVRVLPERERVLFLQTGENHPSFTKSNTKNRKAKSEA
jgi:hypothetical protein